MIFVFFHFLCLISSLFLQLEGKIVAPTKSAWAYNKNKNHLISIRNVENLTVNGSGGLIDGLGSSWWPCKSCPRPAVTTLLKLSFPINPHIK